MCAEGHPTHQYFIPTCLFTSDFTLLRLACVHPAIKASATVSSCDGENQPLDPNLHRPLQSLAEIRWPLQNSYTTSETFPHKKSHMWEKCGCPLKCNKNTSPYETEEGCPVKKNLLFSSLQIMSPGLKLKDQLIWF